MQSKASRLRKELESQQTEQNKLFMQLHEAMADNSTLSQKLARVENQVRTFTMELEEYRSSKALLGEEHEKLKQNAKGAAGKQVVHDYEENIKKIEHEKVRLFTKIQKLENSVKDLKTHNKGLERVLNQVKTGETKPEELQQELSVLIEKSERS